MTSENRSKSKLWIAGGAAGVAILLLGFSIRSLVVLFVEPQPSGAAKPESVAAQEKQNVSATSAEQAAQNNEQAALSIPAPAPVPAAPVPAPKKTSEFDVDYQTLREREAGRKETIATLREIAKDNPESGYAMTDEQLRKFEKSGGSFQ